MIPWQTSKNITQHTLAIKMDSFGATFAEVLLNTGCPHNVRSVSKSLLNVATEMLLNVRRHTLLLSFYLKYFNINIYTLHRKQFSLYLSTYETKYIMLLQLIREILKLNWIHYYNMVCKSIEECCYDPETRTDFSVFCTHSQLASEIICLNRRDRTSQGGLVGSWDVGISRM